MSATLKGGLAKTMEKVRKLFLTAIITIVILTSSAMPLLAAETWQDVADEAKTYLNKSLIAYKDKDTQTAVGFVNDAYFGPIEMQGMEAAMGQSISIKRVREMEGKFRKIKKWMKAGEPVVTIEQEISELKNLLDEDATVLDGGAKNPYTMLIASFLIIFREGVEAILILGAIITYLIKSGNKEKVKSIYAGVGAAVVLSIITWAALTFFLKSAGYGVELIEGITLLMAMIVLFTVSHWLLSKAQAQVWQKYIQGKIQDSVSRGSMFALTSAGFLAVYREGAEIVLFYKALVARAANSWDIQMLIAGFVAGLIALTIFYFAYKLGSVRIPIKPFFIATGLLLYTLAFIFAGEGVNKLQIAGIVDSTEILYVPAIDSLGVYPTLQTTAIQIILVIALASAMIYQRLSIRGTTKKGEA